MEEQMARRPYWLDDEALYKGPDHEGYCLIDGGGYEATEVLALTDAWVSSDSRAVDARLDVRECWHGLAALLDALIEAATHDGL